MDITEVEHMKAKIVTSNGAVIYMERTDEVSDADWASALATIHLSGEVRKAAKRVVKRWSSGTLADAVTRLSIALREVCHYRREYLNEMK